MHKILRNLSIYIIISFDIYKHYLYVHRKVYKPYIYAVLIDNTSSQIILLLVLHIKHNTVFAIVDSILLYFLSFYIMEDTFTTALTTEVKNFT